MEQQESPICRYQRTNMPLPSPPLPPPSILCYKDFLLNRNPKAAVVLAIHFTGSKTNEGHKLLALELHFLFFPTLRREEAWGAAVVFWVGAGDPVEIPELTQSCRMGLICSDLAPALWLWLFSPLCSTAHIIFPHNYFGKFLPESSCAERWARALQFQHINPKIGSAGRIPKFWGGAVCRHSWFCQHGLSGDEVSSL